MVFYEYPLRKYLPIAVVNCGNMHVTILHVNGQEGEINNEKTKLTTSTNIK